MRPRMVARVALLALVALLLGACGGARRAPVAKRLEPTPEAIRRETEQGPVKATVQLWPPSPTLGDPIYLRLTVEAKPGATAVAAFEHEALGRFRVIGWTHDSSRRDDGTVVELQTYTLEAPGSGKFRVPPLRIAVGDQELLTEELPLTVAAIDPARAAQELAPAQGRLDPRRDVPYGDLLTVLGIWGVVMRVSILLAVVAAIIYGVVRARRKRTLDAQVSAYDHAVRRLEWLIGRGAPDAGHADDWFVELSGIVRQYLEGRFGLRASELTTEEFLQEARRAAELLGPQRELLAAFLERCDRVKFAGYRPDADESMATLHAARAFVEETRLRPQEAA